MNKTKKILSIILTVVMILSTISVSASAAIMIPCGACNGTGSVAVTCEECGGNGCPLCGGEGSIYEDCDVCDGTGKLEPKPIIPEDPEPTEPALDFVIDDDDVVVEYIGEGGDVVIPEGVKTIGRNAFESCHNIVSVTIPSTVTAIGNEVDELDRTAAYEVWTIANQYLPEGEYTMIAKNSDGVWDSPEDGCKIKIENSRTNIDVISVVPAVTEAAYGEKFDVRVVTGSDILKVTIRYNGVDYKTFTPTGKDEDGNNVFDCFIASGVKGENTITVQYKTADGWFDCTDVFGTVTIGKTTTPAL